MKSYSYFCFLIRKCLADSQFDSILFRFLLSTIIGGSPLASDLELNACWIKAIISTIVTLPLKMVKIAEREWVSHCVCDLQIDGHARRVYHKGGSAEEEPGGKEVVV